MLRSFTIPALAVIAATGAFTPVHRTRPSELEKLDYFVGDWFEEGDVKAGPWGAGGRVTQKDHREWMDGKFFVVIHSTFTALHEDGSGISLMGYDPATRSYTWDEFYSQGEADHSRGHIEGNQWIWNMIITKPGSQMMARYTMTIVSPTVYTFKFERSADSGATWTLGMDGTGRKEPASPGTSR